MWANWAGKALKAGRMESVNQPELVSRLHSWYRSSVSGAEQPMATADVLCPPEKNGFGGWTAAVTSLPIESEVQGRRDDVPNGLITLNLPSNGHAAD